MSDIMLVPWDRQSDKTLFECVPELHSIWSQELSTIAAYHTRQWEIDPKESGNVLIAYAGDAIIGVTGWYRMTDTEAGLRWHGVLPHARKNGYSRQMINLVQAAFCKCGFEVVTDAKVIERAVQHAEYGIETGGWVLRKTIKKPQEPIDAYADLATLYLSIVTLEEAQAQDIDDPVMSTWIAETLPDNATILDAGCGLGFHLMALHQGLPAKATGKKFDVSGSDCSASMLSEAVKNGAKVGIPASAYKVATFAELRDIPDWSAHFDCVLVNYAIYTHPGIANYDDYLKENLTGLGSVLKPGGHLLFNLRDWPSFILPGKVHHDYENEHDGVSYRCRYTWQFRADGNHVAHLVMSNATTGLTSESDVHFAERSPEQVADILLEQGWQIIDIQPHGTSPLKFNTVIARKL